MSLRSHPERCVERLPELQLRRWLGIVPSFFFAYERIHHAVTDHMSGNSLKATQPTRMPPFGRRFGNVSMLPAIAHETNDPKNSVAELC